MTNRQSNIIFYTIISLIVYALLINFLYPKYFENLTKSETELSIQEAINKGEHKIAINLYQQLLEERLSNDNENTAENAEIYEQMAKLYLLLGDKEEEKNYYLKSISIKEQLKKANVLGLASTYDKLGSLAEEEKDYDQAQIYYEKSLAVKLGDTNKEEDQGLFVGMQNSREKYLRLNNEMTIDTFKKLGEIHNIKKEHKIAKNYYEQALTASKLTYGENDDKTLELMHMMNRIED